VALLAGLAALGTITSIASVMWLAEATPAPGGPRRKCATVLRDLESVCLQLQEAFRKLARGVHGGAVERVQATTPLKFGLHGLAHGGEPTLGTQAAIVDLARALPVASQAALDVIAVIEDGAIEVPEDLFYKIGECQERLNLLLTERASLATSIDVGLEVAGQLTAIAGTLRSLAKD
jgi:hypothetical protein